MTHNIDSQQSREGGFADQKLPSRTAYLMKNSAYATPEGGCKSCGVPGGHEFYTRGCVPVVVFDPSDALPPGNVVEAPSGMTVKIVPWVDPDETEFVVA